VVPPGFRKSEPGGAKKYYGYRIRVFYHNELQDADARPKSLLNGLTGEVDDVTNRPLLSVTGTGSS
jgi:hypothetical protein